VEDHHPEISEDRLFFFEREEVVVEDFDATGFILDIGGGGEGVIGKLKGEQVIAIDPSKRELEGAAAGPLKIIMDATDLQFLDETFNIVTSFYTLMYIREVDAHREVFGEVYRVLTPGGRFLIWDAIFPPRLDEEKDVAVFWLTVKLPEEEVDAKYGMLWPEGGRGVAYYVELAESAGFELVLQREEGQRFFLELRKL
jgi:ubiquinone/menaquinone biosynthesis C-methylase UbiE